MRLRLTPTSVSSTSRARRAPRKNALPSSLQITRQARGPWSMNRQPVRDQGHHPKHVNFEPVPGHDHPVHTSTLRPELGHHMYSTGTFATGLHKMGCASAALQLYSHGPINASSYPHSHREKLRNLFQENTGLLLESVWSACYYLYLVALGALRSQASSRDVHAHVFSLPGKSLAGPNRTWNLVCQLGKSADGRNLLSRPLLSFQAATARIFRFSGVKIDGQNPRDMNLHLVIKGSLKAYQPQNPTSGQSAGHGCSSPLQSIVDDLAKQSVCAVMEQKHFESAASVASTIRLRLTSYLPSSPIAAALDLNHLGIILIHGAGNQRLVQNILLNHDGSIKTDALMPVSLPMLESNSAIDLPSEDPKELTATGTPIESENHNEAVVRIEPKRSSVAPQRDTKYWKPSETTHVKLGADVTFRVIANSSSPNYVDKQLPVLEELDRHCQVSDAKGFAALIYAAMRIYEASPSSPSFILDGHCGGLSSSASAISDMSQAGVSRVQRWGLVRSWDVDPAALQFVHTPALGYIEVRIHVPGILGVPIKLGNETQQIHFFINLVARVYLDGGVPSNSDCTSTISDEVFYLRKAADMIVGRICQATAFESLDACVEVVAEALLRFIKFRFTNLQPRTVQVRGAIESPPGQITSVRSTATELKKTSSMAKNIAECKVKVETGETSIRDATTGILVRAKFSLRENSGLGQYNDGVSEVAGQDEPPGRTSAESESDNPIVETVSDYENDHECDHESGTTLDTPGIENAKLVSEAGKRLSIKPEVINGFCCPCISIHRTRSSTPLSQHTELADYRFSAYYLPRHAVALAQISPATIDSIVASVMMQPDADSLHELYLTAKKVREAMPFDPWLMGLDFRYDMTPVSRVRDSRARRPGWAQVQFHLRADPGLHGARGKWDRRPEMTVINLPPLRFPVSDFEGTVETVSVQLTLQTHLHANRGKGIPTMLSHLCDVARQVIAPILSGEIPVSMDEFSERCSQAILQNGQLLSEGLSASSVQVTTQLHPTPQRRTWHAVGALPDAYIKNKLKKFIALGSNVGDRIEALEIACRTLDQDEEIHVVETSPLYETEPMYVEDQDCFLNGVCEIVTNLGPLELLDRLQAIENGLGRHKTIDKGPRNIDLDILTYGQRTVSTERLTVPHALMLEREFVLRPLCDTSGGSWPHPSTHESAEAHLRRLPPSTTPMFPITALGAGLEPLRSLDPKRKTRVMSILNVTPDSFSDGGMNQPTDLNHLKETILANLAAGATIIDIGGQSSRPNADDVSAEEEISRVLPAIELIKSLPEAQGIAISIDTYRASVAEAAVKAGAHIVNDISAGLLDPDMLSTIARLGCTYIMMHMRGTPATMQNEENTSYPDGLIPSVANELRGRLNAAREAGIRRWRIILDPGIGFAKTLEQNVELLKRFAELRDSEGLTTYPWLVGTSRKGFIGKVTGVKDAKDRVGGTAATVTAAVQGGAEIVRVHDVNEMVEVVKMADAMYRG